MSTIDDKKNGRQPIVFGDVKAFLKETITHIVYVVLWGIGGAFFFTLVKSFDKSFDNGHSMADIILPTDLDKPPYNGTKNQQYNVLDIIHKKGVDKFRAILEWIYPMDHAGFPYNLDTKDAYNSHFISKLWNNYVQWLVNSCKYTFSMYRYIYKGILLFFYIILNSWKEYPILNEIISTLMFYVSPILVLLISFVPWMVPVGFVLAIAGAVLGKNSFINISWLLAPYTVAIVSILQFTKSPSFLFSATLWVVVLIGFLLSLSVVPISSLLCFGLIGVALWIYSIFFFICSPLTQEGGVQRVKETIGLHWKGLTILFLGLVTKSALIHLSSTLFTGVTVGVIISLFLLYRA
jgi:hypothetical protein